MNNKDFWEDFRNAGMLWFVNSILHAFGWAIQIKIKDDEYSVFPIRTKYRGFSEKDNNEGYKRVTEYLKNNIDDIADDVKDL
ncbi:MAG: hypothetical protein ACRC4W_08605 [Treponemataceae bacterium]